MTATVRFTEEMLGHVTFGESDFARGAQPDRDGSGAFMFHLTIEVQDIESFSHDPLRPATAVGYVKSDALGGKLPVEQGWFNLFVDVEPGVKHMLYRLWFRDSRRPPADDDRASRSSTTTPASTCGRTPRRCSRACCAGTCRRATTRPRIWWRPGSSGSARATSRSS